MNQSQLFKSITNRIIQKAGKSRPWMPAFETPDNFSRPLDGLLRGKAGFDLIPIAEHIFHSTQACVEFKDGGDRASYIPGYDFIRMPHPRGFWNVEGYYSTLFHELGHWTGHRRRLDRKIMKDGPFPDTPAEKATEEMTAELTSAFILGTIGLDDTERHTPYIVNHFTIGAAGDLRCLNKAIEQAGDAARFILEKAK